MKYKEQRIFTALLVLSLGIAEYFLSKNVYYTEGEVASYLYLIIALLNISLLTLAFVRPRVPAGAGFTTGGFLILWQAHENAKAAKIHEEIKKGKSHRAVLAFPKAPC